MPSTASFFNIINNVYDSATSTLKTVVSYVHTHGTNAQGGQLDWDVIWTDAVHDHSTNAEGGLLDWDTCWTDAVHSHGTNTEGGTLDHGLSMTAASLLDDDHTQYVQENVLTTNGDIPYATGSATWTRLAIGSANTSLSVNSGGTGYSWISAVAHITSGSYTGLSVGSNRAITHSLGLTPKLVAIQDTTDMIFFRIFGDAGNIYWVDAASGGGYSLTIADGTSFYVGTAASYTHSADNSARAYRWVAEG